MREVALRDVLGSVEASCKGISIIHYLRVSSLTDLDNPLHDITLVIDELTASCIFKQLKNCTNVFGI